MPDLQVLLGILQNGILCIAEGLATFPAPVSLGSADSAVLVNALAAAERACFRSSITILSCLEKFVNGDLSTIAILMRVRRFFKDGMEKVLLAFLGKPQVKLLQNFNLVVRLLHVHILPLLQEN